MLRLSRNGRDDTDAALAVVTMIPEMTRDYELVMSMISRRRL
jgi:hypothetical protein